MSVLFDSPEIRKEIERVRVFATKNPVVINSEEDLKTVKVVGDDPNHVVHNGSYRIVFSLEIQKDRPLRHLSVSVNKEGKYPSVVAVNAVMEQFGFKTSLTSNAANACSVYIDKKSQSLNVIELME